MEDESYCVICEQTFESCDLYAPVKEGNSICKQCLKEIQKYEV